MYPVVVAQCSGDNYVHKLENTIEAQADLVDGEVYMSYKTPLLPVSNQLVASVDEQDVRVEHLYSHRAETNSEANLNARRGIHSNLSRATVVLLDRLDHVKCQNEYISQEHHHVVQLEREDCPSALIALKLFS